MVALLVHSRPKKPARKYSQLYLGLSDCGRGGSLETYFKHSILGSSAGDNFAVGIIELAILVVM